MRSGPGSRRPIENTDRHLVLQIGTDARQIDNRRNTLTAQRVGVANSGKHQKLRRVDDAAGKNDFAPRADRLDLIILLIDEADSARAFHDNAMRQSVNFDAEIWATQGRVEVCGCSAATTAIADRQLTARKALLLSSIIIWIEGETRFRPSRDISVDERVLVATVLCRHGPFAAAVEIPRRLPGFLPPK